MDRQGHKTISAYTQCFMALMLCGGALAACTPEMDMQGVDPRTYYDEHPIKNQVETHSLSQQVHFGAGEPRLDNGEIMRLRHALHDVSPMAADGVRVQMATLDYSNKTRRRHLLAVLRSMGFTGDKISFQPSGALSRGDVRVDVQYAVVVPPDCPDWRRSPVTTYSNTMQGNFRCATEVNLGVMVADPHDLVHGPSRMSPDTQRSVRVVDQYHGGEDFSKPVSVSSTGGGDSGGSEGGLGDDAPPPAE